MIEAYIGLGSNLEEPIAQLRAALLAIEIEPEMNLITDSGYYISKPMGPADQPDYVNAVAKISTRLSAISLLDRLQKIENMQGRVREIRWHARTLDLDLLLYGNEQIDLPRLQVPHPGICQRDFVYLPLLKVNADIVIPGCGRLSDIVATASEKNYGAEYIGAIG